MPKFFFIDDLITHRWDRSESFFKPDVRELAAAQTFRIDNVDQYLWSHQDNFDTLESMPNVAPPFENFFMFVEQTDMRAADVGLYRNRFPGYRYGVWFLVSLIEDAHDDWAIEWFSSRGLNRLQLKARGVKWRIYAFIFNQYGKNYDPKCWAIGQFLVKDDGQMLEFGSDWRFDRHALNAAMKDSGRDEDEASDYLSNHAIAILFPCFFALSLMHCKNVEERDPELTPKERYTRQKFEQAKKSTAAKWKVLYIEPMRKILRSEGNSESTGLLNALHICRGHFKDYRQGRGLFGKHKDIYWWDQHMRGDESAGVVIKDYALKPPDDD